MKSNKKTQSVSVKTDSLNHGCNKNSKIYDVFFLKTSCSCPFSIEITPPILEHYNRGDIFRSIFKFILPNLNLKKSVINTTIDRSFFSPFNCCSEFNIYSCSFDYIKNIPFFSKSPDLLPIACFQFYKNGVLNLYILFAKEVSNGSL